MLIFKFMLSSTFGLVTTILCEEMTTDFSTTFKSSCTEQNMSYKYITANLLRKKGLSITTAARDIFSTCYYT